MAYTNSPLVNYTKISPNKTVNRKHKIDTITIHCVVGQCSVETLGNVFAPKSRQASSNYGIGPDGRIGMYCEEKDRSWCSGGKDLNGKVIRVNGISGSDNDHRAVTIEVASDTKAPYKINDKAMASLIKLVADICKRNGIKKLLWEGDKSLVGQIDKQNMTVHRWFSTKSCPGDYLYEKHGYIADEVNKLLGVEEEKKVATSTIKAGTAYSLKNEPLYAGSGSKEPANKVTGVYYAWDGKIVKGRISITNSKANVGKSGQITGWIAAPKVEAKPAATADKSFKVKVTAEALRIRKGPSISSAQVGMIRDKGIYTIVETAKGPGAGSAWGKLKSGAGWISLDFTKRV